MEDFLAQLRLGLAKIDFSYKQFKAAEERFRAIAEELPKTDAAPEALYWAGVSKYKATDDGSALSDTAAALSAAYPDSIWAKKASVWSS